jgi:hypothetical protein
MEYRRLSEYNIHDSESSLNKLNEELKAGWEIFQIVTTQNAIHYILRKAKKQVL